MCCLQWGGNRGQGREIRSSSGFFVPGITQGNSSIPSVFSDSLSDTLLGAGPSWGMALTCSVPSQGCVLVREAAHTQGGKAAFKLLLESKTE